MPTIADIRTHIDWIRSCFPALSRLTQGQVVACFDGPAGSQVPASVAQAVANYLLETNANHGGVFATSVASDQLLDASHAAVADLLGSSDPKCVVFGANMTSLTLALSRSLARTWKPGDEIIVSRLDHDANFTPWILAARDSGVTVRTIDVCPADCTLDFASFERALSDQTRLVAVGYASNFAGTINPVHGIVRRARAVGALTFIDAVHFAPHGLIDVEQLGCDFLVCSAYKFFGPHVGILWSKRSHLESILPYKLRPAPESLPGRWMTGTQNHEGITGVRAAVEYLAELGRRLMPAASSRRAALDAAYDGIVRYERLLSDRLRDGLRQFPDIRVHGITDDSSMHQRVPTFSFTRAKQQPRWMAQWLSDRGVSAWAGNQYALPLTESLGLEPDGALRIGMLHYNTMDEIDRLLDLLREMPCA